MKQSVCVFLGSNSGEGFFSLYDQLLNARFDDLLIIKGGPGCGKSSFMRTVAERLCGAGEDAVFVRCSGDPDSLDAVLFPHCRVGLVDGTSPHVLEPSYTAAAERYLDLSRFYDLSALRSEREAIICHTDAYRRAYAKAYRILRAADALSAERRSVVHAGFDGGSLTRRVEAILRRELRGGSGKPGRVDRAFLGGLTHKGELCRFDTVDALCPKVYAFSDSYGLAAAALRRACESAAAAGCDVLVCPNPDRPREPHHVLVPERGLAFITSTARLPYPGKPFRTLRFDAAVQLSRPERAKLRLTGRLERALRDEAAEALAEAKHSHDALEAAYNPFVDFDGVYALAEQEAQRILGER